MLRAAFRLAWSLGCGMESIAIQSYLSAWKRHRFSAQINNAKVRFTELRRSPFIYPYSGESPAKNAEKIWRRNLELNWEKLLAHKICERIIFFPPVKLE